MNKIGEGVVNLNDASLIKNLFLLNINLMLPFKSSSASLLKMMTPTFLTEQIRTRITCSKREGKEKSVKTAIERYFRIDKSIWIKSKPGKFLFRKNLFKILT